MDTEKIQELVQRYLEKYRPEDGSPQELFDEYDRVRQEIQQRVAACQNF